MFVISLNYKSVEDVDRALADHRAFLDKYYADETFICSGGKIPRTGGVILARKVSRERLEEILKEDPFYIQGLAEYTITEFVASKHLAKFKDLTD